MKTFMSYRSVVKGLAALALVFSVSCGKKGGGGGGAVTPPATNGDCSTSDANCEVGQSYTAGTYLGSGHGETYYGSNKQLDLFMGFFATGTVDKDGDQVKYNGKFVANGTMKIANGSYGLLTNQFPSRNVAVSIEFYWDFGFGGGGYDNGYDDDYGYDDGYDDTCYSGCDDDYGYDDDTCYSGCGNDYDIPKACQLPNGSYKVETTTAGTWDDKSYGAKVSNLKLKITGSSKTIVASFTGSVDNNGDSDEVGQLTGTLSFKSINGKTNCALEVKF